MNETREPDERYETTEVDLGEPTESDAGIGALSETDSLPDPAERDRQVSETRKSMGPRRDEPEERAEAAEDDEPRSPPVEPTELA